MAYINQSMSERAAEAYDRNSMPLSRWTKEKIIEEVNFVNKNININKMTLKLMKMLFLVQNGWHHTGKYFNKTNFYKINADYVENLTQEQIDLIVENDKKERKPREKKAKPSKIWAIVSFTVWEGHYRNYKTPYVYTEIVSFLEGDKIIQTSEGGKRINSLDFLGKFKTEFKARRQFEKLGYKHRMLKK